MLALYLSLFGAWFLPLAKPLVAAVTTLSIIGAWWWMKRRHRQVMLQAEVQPSQQTPQCQSSSCRCKQV